MCVQLSSLWPHPGARAFFKFLFYLFCGHPLSPLRWFYRASILRGFPRCCSEVSSAGPQGFLEETMKGAPTILFGCLWFLLFSFVAVFTGSDVFSMSGGCNPLIVCALVCPSVFCKIIAQSIYGRSLHVYKINLPDARVLLRQFTPAQ